MGDQMLEHLRQLEEAAEEVLSEKQEIVDLDRKRNQNREAIRALTKSSKGFDYDVVTKFLSESMYLLY